LVSRKARVLGKVLSLKRTSMSARSLHWICFEALQRFTRWVSLSLRKSRLRSRQLGDIRVMSRYALVDEDVERAVLLHVLGDQLVAELLGHEVSRDKQALSACLLDELLRLLSAKDQTRSATDKGGMLGGRTPSPPPGGS
jgi:hypothetical protein